MLNQHAFLYVEDDPLSREIMKMMMVNMLHVTQLSLWEDSHNFLDRLKALKPQPTVILLDIHMKPYTGFQMLEMIRELDTFGGAKVVALTASVMNEEVKKLREVGFDGAIGKPISVQTFPSLITRIVQGETVWHIADA